MALKYQLDNLDGLSEEVAKLYKPRAEGGFELDTDMPETLMKALRSERDMHRASDRDAKAAQERANEAQRANEESKRQLFVKDQQLSALRGAVFDRLVSDACREAGLHTFAVADALRAARETFELDAGGGAIVPKQGTATIATWLGAQRDLSPHWWPTTGSGTGSTGQTSRVSAPSETMKRSEFMKLSPAQRAAVSRERKIVD